MKKEVIQEFKKIQQEVKETFEKDPLRLEFAPIKTYEASFVALIYFFKDNFIINNKLRTDILSDEKTTKIFEENFNFIVKEFFNIIYIQNQNFENFNNFVETNLDWKSISKINVFNLIDYWLLSQYHVNTLKRYEQFVKFYVYVKKLKNKNQGV